MHRYKQHPVACRFLSAVPGALEVLKSSTLRPEERPEGDWSELVGAGAPNLEPLMLLSGEVRGGLVGTGRS